uniref:SPP3 n=1 Tax=Arundo donax TaxID=35708 RepID=A0A0A9GJ15_ARUDO
MLGLSLPPREERGLPRGGRRRADNQLSPFLSDKQYGLPLHKISMHSASILRASEQTRIEHKQRAQSNPSLGHRTAICKDGVKCGCRRAAVVWPVVLVRLHCRVAVVWVQTQENLSVV